MLTSPAEPIHPVQPCPHGKTTAPVVPVLVAGADPDVRPHAFRKCGHAFGARFNGDGTVE